jgi:hypothetical protein
VGYRFEVADAVIDSVAIAIGVIAAIAVIALISAAARHRQPITRKSGPAPYRVRGRSIRSWQSSAIREIRRAGRAHGRRGR